MSSFSFSSYVFLLLVAFATRVTAHGHVMSYLIGASTYTAFLPVKTPVYWAPPPSIGRNTGGEGPVDNFLGRDMVCNFNATPISDNGVSRTAPIAAGQEITIQWNGFTHGGPILTYLARCDPDCGSFTGIGTKSWFKLDEAGYDLAKYNGWATQYHFDQKNKWISKIPECLAPGEYLLRHEIIAIGACKNAGSCQLYPSCAQLKVTGQGTVRPEDGSVPLVTFPGAYAKGDPGVFWNSTQDKTLYIPPGPKVWKCPTVPSPSSSVAPSPSTPPSSSTTTLTNAVPTTTRTASISTKTTKTSSVKTSSLSKTTSKASSVSPTTSKVATTSSLPGGVPQWGQCGGTGYTGPTVCESPFVCSIASEFFSQCV